MVELIWDAERSGTARGATGAFLAVGDRAPAFQPDDLLAIAAAGCVMRAFLKVADEAAVPILSYLATAGLESSSEMTEPRLRLRSFVLGPSGVTEQTLAGLAERACQASPVARLLGDRCTAEWNLRVLRGA
ncbi:MAG: OsmC family protein [Vicinamibacterales bacterium]